MIKLYEGIWINPNYVVTVEGKNFHGHDVKAEITLINQSRFRTTEPAAELAVRVRENMTFADKESRR